MVADEHVEPGAGRDVPEAFGSARSRRIELGDAADEMEEVLARPASTPMWSTRVGEALAVLRRAFDDHVVEVERPEGLLNRLVEDEPRLVNGVKRMYGEHEQIDAQLRKVVDLVGGCAPDCSLTMIEDIRVEALELLEAISRHRQAGADLVYEAYNVDIGGG